MTTVPTISRDLTPFEHAVLKLVCDGLTNAAIAREIHHSEKVIENTVSRAAQAFVIEERQQHNLRVMIALAYRAHFGDVALQKLEPVIELDFSIKETRTPTYSQAS
jgi:hypothetical protein